MDSTRSNEATGGGGGGSDIPRPGVLALGAEHTDPAHAWLAAKLLDTCYALYERSPLGLSPEAVTFNTQKGIQGGPKSTVKVNLAGFLSEILIFFLRKFFVSFIVP